MSSCDVNLPLAQQEGHSVSCWASALGIERVRVTAGGRVRAKQSCLFLLACFRRGEKGSRKTHLRLAKGHIPLSLVWLSSLLPLLPLFHPLISSYRFLSSSACEVPCLIPELVCLCVHMIRAQVVEHQY